MSQYSAEKAQEIACKLKELVMASLPAPQHIGDVERAMREVPARPECVEALRAFMG